MGNTLLTTPVAGAFHYAGTADYIADEALQAAVNVSILLGRPLLIKGEPGTGKTTLAASVARDLGLDLISWQVKSTTRAADGLYVYDTVARLHDSRFGDHDVRDIRQYIRLGPLGEAFSRQARTVLLIDEIDKADLEFPNDLLHELDAMSFKILETGDVVTAEQRPIVIISSNNERELPDAFLRRCVFHWIAFPDEMSLSRIVRVHHPNAEAALLGSALRRFFWLRGLDEVRKKPSTSEFIDWIGALLRSGLPRDVLEEKLPFMGVLLKSEQDTAAASKRLGRLPPR